MVASPSARPIKLTGASRNTLKQYYRALVERGTLNLHGSGRGVWYDHPLMALRTRVRLRELDLNWARRPQS